MQLSLRQAVPDDESFLSAVYASTRVDEFAALGWEESQIQGFLCLQFEAQHRSYTLQFPEAVHHIVLLDDQPIGRLLVDGLSLLNPVSAMPVDCRSPVHLIDIAILPSYRHQGIGAHLIHELLSAAELFGISVMLHAQATSPAVRLYQRLGFRTTCQDDMYCEMIWTPKKS